MSLQHRKHLLAAPGRVTILSRKEYYDPQDIGHADWRRAAGVCRRPHGSGGHLSFPSPMISAQFIIAELWFGAKADWLFYEGWISLSS